MPWCDIVKAVSLAIPLAACASGFGASGFGAGGFGFGGATRR
jgi:hypothetical protein